MHAVSTTMNLIRQLSTQLTTTNQHVSFRAVYDMHALSLHAIFASALNFLNFEFGQHHRIGFDFWNPRF